MKSFNILDRHLNIQQSYLVEASAGTGKTFAIEHLVTRLLIEHPSTSIERILVVTFTKAAAAELKQRIQKNLKASLQIIESMERGETIEKEIPDYLMIHFENRESFVQLRHVLKRAFIHFEEAIITTIHSFCHRVLSEKQFVAGDHERIFMGDLLSTQEIKRIVHDFFRFKLRLMDYSPGQLERVLRRHLGSVQRLEDELCKHIKKGEQIHHQTPPFGEIFEEWRAKMKEIKHLFPLTALSVAGDLLQMAPHYYDLCDREGEIKEGAKEEIDTFSRLFDQEEWSVEDFDSLVRPPEFLLYKFSPENRKKTSALESFPSSLCHPSLFPYLQLHIAPLIEKAAHYGNLFGRMVNDCRAMLREYALKEEKFLYNDLLVEMEKAIQHSDFLNQLRNSFDAVIIDEFQDTDPVQWSLFEKVFLSSAEQTVPVYLVGDPKQSIYSFRKADIYTYLRAAEKLGEERRMSLGTNWRSQPRLVNALNALFSSKRFPQGFPLPRFKEGLDYHPVQSGIEENHQMFSDLHGAVHFCIAKAKRGKEKKWPPESVESRILFPYLVQEMERLWQEDHISFSQWAVLVRDHDQAHRLTDYLKSRGIPTWNQREMHFKDSKAVPVLREWLFAILHPRDLKGLKIALTGALFQGNSQHIFALEDEKILNGMYANLYTLRRHLFEEGLMSFFHRWMQSKWWGSPFSVEEQLLSQEGGSALYQELLQLVDRLAESSRVSQSSPHEWLRVLDAIQEGEEEEEDWVVKKDPAQEGVKILTLHMSKGLEFGVVFALGLVNRPPSEEVFLTETAQEASFLRPIQHALDPSLSLFREEGDAEKLRQFYVAATRAKWRTYLPVVLDEKRPHSLAKGTASPMELFLAYAKTSSPDSLYQEIAQEDGEELRAWAEALPQEVGITYEDVDPDDLKRCLSEKGADQENPLLIPPPEETISGKKEGIYSFSSLVRLFHDEVDPEWKHRMVDSGSEKNLHTLPAGSETGTLLHRIFEKIPFHKVMKMKKERQLVAYVRSFLEGTDLNGWEEVVTEMVENVLTFPLMEEDPDFCLAHLQPNEMYREMEFLFPFDSSLFDEAPLSEQAGYLKGVMDLIFIKGGKLYLVDWKSNWLGTDDEAYRLQALEEAMGSHHYHWQKRIYTEAVKRYAQVMGLDPEESLGGVFYIFLRGIDPQKNHRNGVCFYANFKNSRRENFSEAF